MEDELYLFETYKYLEHDLRKKLANSAHMIKNLNHMIKNLNCEVFKIKQQNIFLTNNNVKLTIENNKLKKYLDDLNIELHNQESIIKNYKLKVLEFDIKYDNKSTAHDIYITQKYNKLIYEKELENIQLKAELMDLKKKKEAM